MTAVGIVAMAVSVGLLVFCLFEFRRDDPWNAFAAAVGALTLLFIGVLAVTS